MLRTTWCSHAPPPRRSCRAWRWQPNPRCRCVTTSFVSSGAAASLIPAFEQQTGIRVKLIVVGSGAALRMARIGEVDATLTHSPADEQAFIDEGLAAVVREVMSNDMLIVGPADDPAAARGSDAAAALARIAAAGQPFVSRGDDSGTHRLELSLWKQAGIDPLGQSWYEEIGRGMPGGAATCQPAWRIRACRSGT